jgi:hypothetical protein
VPASDYDLFREYEAFGANDPGERTQGHFSDFLEIYRESGATQLDPDDDQGMFFQFLNAFVPDVENHNKEWWQEIRQEFYDLSGITDMDIDWEAYREAIGYGSS